ncbi:2-C-methyl-D-erythritol 4-phosphate cytidylyltransferase [Pedobacter sp. AW31-3R]|uniref:2-C-methyl-D-erythritol 4-phosphate cytidylyltransferase n=1 Tax=Pedobacter sp. AW31-3R TaxID=3445781 RepID=UPI003FA196A2
MKYYAIIVAGGKGNRMNTSIAKQFLVLNGLPVLMHTLKAFHNCELKPEIILVMNELQQEYWKSLGATYGFDIPHQLVNGGQERYDSVRNGLAAVHGEAVVAIHDAVRPLVSPELILKTYLMAGENGNAIAAIQPVDSVRRKMEDQASVPVNREELFLVQTPQTFHTCQLEKAYQQPFSKEFTDDASVVEKAGFLIHMVPGDRNNLKITYQEDLELAAFLLQKKGP